MKVTLSDWIISVSAAAVSFFIAIAAYFASKWISGVDSALEKSEARDYKLSQNIQELKAEVQKQGMEIPARVGRAFDTKDKEHHRQLADRLLESSDKIQRVEIILREKIFPQLEKSEILTGRVTVVEENQRRLIDGLKRAQK
jgi:hypothetical protein